MRPKAMKEKKDIVENWLPRYTGTPGSTSSLSISKRTPFSMRCAFATVRSTDLGKLKSTMPIYDRR